MLNPSDETKSEWKKTNKLVKKSMATIRDVAIKAGVSASTVSNMLNGRYTVSEEKYKRIKEAMEELQYRPNYMARNLKHPTSKIIGILMPSLEEPYSDIYRGILDSLDLKSYVAVLKLTEDNTVLEDRFIEQLLDIGAIGLFLVPVTPEDGLKYQKIRNSGIPVVALERKIGGTNLPYVLFNNKQQIYDVTTALLQEYPPESLRLYIGRQEFFCEKESAEGFLEAVPSGEGQILEVRDINREGKFNAIYETLIQEPLPSAIVTTSQQIALLVNEACNVLNQEIPIHTLVGENWYTTRIYKNITQYGNNAILLGKKAAQNMEELLLSSYISEGNTTYVPTKEHYELPEVPFIQSSKPLLRALTFRCDAASALRKISKSFENRTGVQLEFTELGYTHLKETLWDNMEQGSDEYDIYMMDIPWLRNILQAGHLYDIAPWAKEDKLMQKFPDTVQSGFYRYDRGLHLLPIIATTQVILYRQDIFENQEIKNRFMKRYGFELTPPRTWNDFNVIAEFFDRAYNPYSPFEHGTAATALEPIGLINEFLPRQWAFHGSIIDHWGKISIDSEENVRALENLVTTFRYTPKETEHYFWDDIFELLVKGEIPMAHGFASHYQPTKYSGIDTYEKYIRCIPIPYKKAMLGGWALGINCHSRHPREAYEYMKWNLNDRVAIANMRLCGCTPVWSVFRNETLKESNDWLNMVGPKVELGKLREELYCASGRQLDPQVVDEVLSGGIKKAIHRELDARDALQEVKENLKRMIMD